MTARADTVGIWFREKLGYSASMIDSSFRIVAPPSSKPIRVLLVDPDPIDAEKVATLLPKNGAEHYEIQHIAGLDGIESVIEMRNFDVLLFDLDTPVGRDAGILNKIIGLAPHTPIIVLTQIEDEDVGIRAVQAGAQDFLVKSRINGDVLRRVIRYSIDRVRFRQDVDGLAQEIAHRKRIADALSESQSRMMAINESLYEGILVFDENGHIALSNRAAEKLLSGTRPLPGQGIDDVLLLKQDDVLLKFADGPFRTVVTSGAGVQDDDAVILRHDGRALAVAYACAPLLEGGRVQGAILSFRDIGGFKQAQRDALQASKLASVGQLAAGIAHEINTPIQYIGDNLGFLSEAFQSIVTLLGRSEQLLTELGGETAEKALAQLSEARIKADADYILSNIPEATRQSLQGVAQVARIVLAMKEFSHPGDKEKSEEDLNRAIENTLAVSRNEWKQWAKVDTDLAPDLPRVYCLAGEINQVLLNLIVNAAHAIEEAKRGPAGKITVTTRRKAETVEIIVEDNGVGMSEAVRQQIFDPFFTTKRVGKGTGQGLAICRDVVVAKHQGQITVDSTPGVGSIFTVTLPIGSGKADSEDNEHNEDNV